MHEPETVTIRIPRTFQTIFFPEDAESDVLTQGPSIHVSGAMIEVRDDGSAGLRQVDFPRPLSPSELRTIPWQQVIDATVRQAIAERLTHDRWSTDNAVLTASEHGARTARQHRRRLTPELLREVATIHAAEGPEAVAETFVVSQRQANRYIARAREEGYLS